MNYTFALYVPLISANKYQRRKLIQSFYWENPTAFKLHSLLTKNNIGKSVAKFLYILF